jgi:methylamine dehydrogenase accessory protein MauD
MSSLVAASYVALWILVLVEAVAIFALYHHFGEMYLSSREGRAQQGPELGSSLQPRELVDLQGSAVRLPSAAAPALLLFASTTCRPCQKLRPELRELAARRGSLEALVVCAGEQDEVRRWSAELDGRVRVVADRSGRLALDYGIALTPFCVAVDRFGTVRAKGIVNDGAGLERMADEAAAAGAPAAE